MIFYENTTFRYIAYNIETKEIKSYTNMIMMKFIVQLLYMNLIQIIVTMIFHWYVKEIFKGNYPSEDMTYKLKSTHKC